MLYYKVLFVLFYFMFLGFTRGKSTCEPIDGFDKCEICSPVGDDLEEEEESGFKRIVCEHANLKDVPDQFNSFENITIKFDDIIILPSLNKFNKLVNLALNFNGIRLIGDGALANLSNLLHLSLAYNHIIDLDSKTFEGLKNLNHLKLTSNRIYFIDFQVFTSNNVPLLAYLDLNQNNIVKIERGSFQGLDHLITLDLSMNKIENLERFGSQNHKLINLKMLNLGYNKISIIPEDFFDFLPALEQLRLEHNYLTTVSQNYFKSLSNTLTILDLQGNLISEVRSKCFQDLLKLEKIDLSHNQLKELKIKTLPDKSKRNNAELSLLIYSNPIDCSHCDNSWMVEDQYMKIVNHLNETLCEAPTNITFGDATPTLFRHCQNTSESSIKTTTLFIVFINCFILIVLVSLFVMYRLRKNRLANVTLSLGERGNSTSPSKGSFSYRGLEEQFPFSIDEADENRL